MGIPSYFSYIVKNHSKIIQKYMKTMQIHNLYMDCNSVIYDVIHTNPSTITNKDIIQGVVTKIETYIATICPSKLIFIAFDGVAPVAKLEQQRIRRYKSHFQNEMSRKIYPDKESAWNTAAITPGTDFMQELNKGIIDYFSLTSKYPEQKIIVSTSADVGEGEHKLFHHIRHNPLAKDEASVVYGLDADLIMLAINHLPVSPQIYLFRETPEFIKSIDNSLEPGESYLLDIPLLAETICQSMTTTNPKSEQLIKSEQITRTYDYIFLCFFLGNDFMPHFPALNIRTGGIDKLLNAYKATMGPKDLITDGTKIYWKNLRKVVEHLAKLEEEYFKTETKLRDKREKYAAISPEETPEQQYQKFESIPTYERIQEKYINPFKEGWQHRYYLSLFKLEINDERRKQISINYMQGLEWTMKYYTSGCADWQWKYQHNYPPLLQDLLKYIPCFDTEFIDKERISYPVSEVVQLLYVLPNQSLHLLPKEINEKIDKAMYPTDCDFVWAYCRYFWESHVELPELDIDELIRKFPSN